MVAALSRRPSQFECDLKQNRNRPEQYRIDDHIAADDKLQRCTHRGNIGAQIKNVCHEQEQDQKPYQDLRIGL